MCMFFVRVGKFISASFSMSGSETACSGLLIGMETQMQMGRGVGIRMARRGQAQRTNISPSHHLAQEPSGSAALRPLQPLPPCGALVMMMMDLTDGEGEVAETRVKVNCPAKNVEIAFRFEGAKLLW